VLESLGNAYFQEVVRSRMLLSSLYWKYIVIPTLSPLSLKSFAWITPEMQADFPNLAPVKETPGLVCWAIAPTLHSIKIKGNTHTFS